MNKIKEILSYGEAKQTLKKFGQLLVGFDVVKKTVEVFNVVKDFDDNELEFDVKDMLSSGSNGVGDAAPKPKSGDLKSKDLKYENVHEIKKSIRKAMHEEAIAQLSDYLRKADAMGGAEIKVDFDKATYVFDDSNVPKRHKDISQSQSTDSEEEFENYFISTEEKNEIEGINLMINEEEIKQLKGAEETLEGKLAEIYKIVEKRCNVIEKTLFGDEEIESINKAEFEEKLARLKQESRAISDTNRDKMVGKALAGCCSAMAIGASIAAVLFGKGMTQNQVITMFAGVAGAVMLCAGLSFLYDKHKDAEVLEKDVYKFGKDMEGKAEALSKLAEEKNQEVQL